MTYQEHQHSEGLKPTKYVIGNEETEGHKHVFYLRDDLPLPTATAAMGGDAGYRYHAHSIDEGGKDEDGNDTVVCSIMFGHTHTNLVIEEAGDYTPRVLYIF